MTKQKSKTKEFDYRQIDSFEKVLEFKGETLEQFQERTKGMDVDTVGYEKCKAIVFALNGGKHVKQGYYPWFYNPNRSSASFSYLVCLVFVLRLQLRPRLRGCRCPPFGRHS